jgi:hypothetical protein
MRPLSLNLLWILWLITVWQWQPSQAEPSPTPSAALAASPTASPVTMPAPTLTATPPLAVVLSPQAGQALQGSVVIQGTSRMESFKSAELSFAYANNPTGTWFLIALADTAVLSGTLGTWDTTTLTDGTYDLRLTVTRQDSSMVSTVVKGLRVRNYTPIETSTPTPVTPTATPLPGELPTATPTLLTTITPTPTALPPNPASMVPRDVALSVGQGALGVAGFFALMGVYGLVRKIIKSKS